MTSMSGVSLEIDAKLEKQVLAILTKHGLINAEDLLLSELERGRSSGLSPRTHKEIWKY